MTVRLERARADGVRFVVFTESANLSMVERQLGNLERARDLSLEALDIVVGNGDEMSIAWVINGIAAVEAAMGRHERAATLLFAAESLLERAGGEWPADERAQFEGTVQAVTSCAPARVPGRCAGFRPGDDPRRGGRVRLVLERLDDEPSPWGLADQRGLPSLEPRRPVRRLARYQARYSSSSSRSSSVRSVNSDVSTAVTGLVRPSPGTG